MIRTPNKRTYTKDSGFCTLGIADVSTDQDKKLGMRKVMIVRDLLPRTILGSIVYLIIMFPLFAIFFRFILPMAVNCLIALFALIP